MESFLSLTDLYSSGMDLVNSFKSSFKVWAGPFLVFVVRDAKEVEILLNSEKCFEKPKMIYNTFFSYGMLTMGGDSYKLHRKTILPLFYPTALQRYSKIINAKVNNFLTEFDGVKSSEIEMSEYVLDFSLDSFFATMFGMNIDKKIRRKFLHDAEK